MLLKPLQVTAIKAIPGMGEMQLMPKWTILSMWTYPVSFYTSRIALIIE